MLMSLTERVEPDSIPVEFGEGFVGLDSLAMSSVVQSKEDARKEFERFINATDLPEGEIA